MTTKANQTLIKEGSKDLGDYCYINWYLFTDMEAAQDYVETWLIVGCAGAGQQFGHRPSFRQRRNGQVLVTQTCGIDI